MTNNICESKANPFKLSNQVKNILNSKGYTAVFNYSDYHFFKRRSARAFNRAYAIAEQFIADATQEQNDFNQYIF